MKYKILSIALLLPFTVFASNTVTFLGEVSDSTCNITVNGASGNVSVQLPTVAATQLATIKDVAGNTPFTFTITGCSGTTQTKVGMRLVSASTTAGGNLVNIATTKPAENVSIQILDEGITTAANKPINFTLGEYYGATSAFPANNASTVLTFSAQYYAEGAAKAGKVQSQLQYALAYE